MPAKGKKLLKIKRAAAFKNKKLALRRNDKVQIMSGNDSEKIGSVLRIDAAKQRVVIEGANMRFKHVKKSQQNPQGGRIESEGTIALSNVLLYCEKCGRGVRHRIQIDGDKKTRACVKCSADLG